VSSSPPSPRPPLSYAPTPRVRSSPHHPANPIPTHSPARKPAPRPPPHASSAPAPPADPLRFRKLPLLLGGLTAFAIAGYGGYIYVSYTRAAADDVAAADVPLDVSARYDDIAGTFDGDVEYAEWAMGLLKLRRRIGGRAEGDVCEVSVGTGRTMGFYAWGLGGGNGKGDGKGGEGRGKVRSFTAVDKSARMIDVAREKFEREFPAVEGVRWIVQDATLPLPLPPSPSPSSSSSSSRDSAPKKYDTIVQTMGLCSTPDPVALLRNLGAHLAPSGRILLLEHGRSGWGFVNRVLDATAPRHASRFGCWWNRDVGAIVGASGLEVVEVRRSNWGTTWWVELKLPETPGEVR
jgi:methyltransferase OMS1, mitochondrial